MRLHRAVASGLLLSLALSACVPPGTTRSPAETAAANQAEDLYRQGQFDQAAQAYLALAQQGPAASRDHYRLLAAEALREEGALDRAAPVLAQVQRESLGGDEPVRLDLLKAELALGRNDAATALQLTTQPSVTVPKPLQLRLLELRARAMAGTGDTWGAARTRVEMDDQLEGIDRTQNRSQALDLLARLGPDPLRQRAAAMQPGDRMLPWVDEALTRLGVAVAHPQQALGQPVGSLLPGGNASVREGYQVPQHIALLLPAGGNFATASSAIREGFFAAYIDAGRNNAPRPSVRVYDSGGTGPAAVQAYQQAVADGAQLVVGPLGRAEVSAVFAQPSLPAPVLALNQSDDKTPPASGASAFGLLPETEGTQAADHMIERGLHEAFLLVSSEDYAQRASRSFKAEFEAKGGRIAGMASVDPGTVNYASAIRGLGAPTATAEPAGAPAAAGSAAPGADAGTGADSGAGIFISMHPQQARLLLPQLKLARIALPVFATSHIYAGSDDAGADRDLEGVEFCDAPWLFDAQPGLPSHAEVAAQLPAARGTSARLFAFGMDAWNLVPYIDWLHAHPGSYVPGATGQLTADNFGHVRRVLVWARFQDGLARPLNGSLEMDNAPALAPPPEGGAPAPAASSGLPAPATSAPF
jgi:hypothetical protein